MAVVGSLLIKVRADAGGVQSGMRNASQAVGRFGSQMKGGEDRLRSFGRRADMAGNNLRTFGRSAGAAGNMLRSMLGPLAAFVSATLVIRKFRQEMERVDEIGKTSIRLGIDVEQLSAFQFAAERSGIAANQFNMAVQRMTRRVAEAAMGTGEAKDAIAELGLSAKELNAAGPAVALKRIAEALSRIKNPADRLRLAFKLFDSEGVKMLQMFEDGAAGIDKLMAEAKALGVVVDQEMVNKFTTLNDALTDMRAAWAGLARQIGNMASGPLLEAVNRMTALARLLQRLQRGSIEVAMPSREAERRMWQNPERAAANIRAAQAQTPSARMQQQIMDELRQSAASIMQRGLDMNMRQQFAPQLFAELGGAGNNRDIVANQLERLNFLYKRAAITQDEYARGINAMAKSYKAAQDAATAAAAAIQREFETPMERFQRQMEELQNLVRSGALDMEFAKRAAAGYFEELQRAQTEPIEAAPMSGALLQGSQEAFAKVLEIEGRMSVERQAAQQREELQRELERHTRQLEIIAQNTKGVPVG